MIAKKIEIKIVTPQILLNKEVLPLRVLLIICS